LSCVVAKRASERQASSVKRMLRISVEIRSSKARLPVFPTATHIIRSQQAKAYFETLRSVLHRVHREIREKPKPYLGTRHRVCRRSMVAEIRKAQVATDPGQAVARQSWPTPSTESDGARVADVIDRNLALMTLSTDDGEVEAGVVHHGNASGK